MKRTKDAEGRWIPSKKAKSGDGEFVEELVDPWTQLYRQIHGVRCSPTDDHRQFKAWLGVHPDVAEMAWVKYSDDVFLKDRIHLALVLNFLKKMPTMQNGAASFNYSSHLSKVPLVNSGIS